MCIRAFCSPPLCAVAKEVSIDFSKQGYSNGSELSTITLDNGNITLSFAKGSNSSNSPKYYDTGKAARLYGGNTMMVTSNAGNITKAVFSVDSNNAIKAGSTVNVGSLSGLGENTTTWTGNAPSFMLKQGGTSGHCRITNLTITYADGGEPSVETVATPAIEPNGGEVEAGSKILVNCDTEGASIVYKWSDGEEVNTGENIVEIDAQAGSLCVWATKDGMNNSAVVTADFTIKGDTPVPPTPSTNGQWILVKDAYELVAGMHFIIVNQEAKKAVKTEANQNNRKAVDITLNEGLNVAEISSDVMIFELGGSENAWTIATINYLGDSGNGYIGNTNKSKNYCFVGVDIADAPAKISIAKDTYDANIKFTTKETSRNILKYNPNTNGDPLFACYSSGQKTVHIYKFVETAPERPVLAEDENDGDKIVITGAEGTTIHWRTVEGMATAPAKAASDLAGWNRNDNTETPHVLSLSKDAHDLKGKTIEYMAVSASGLQSDKGMFAVADDGVVTGIEGFEAEAVEAEVEWFNLQGVRIANPESGLYIRRQGNKISKVVVR